MMSLFKRACLAAALAGLASGAVYAQSAPPPLPPLTTAQSAQLEQQMASYRAEVDARVGRGEMDPDEAQRLLSWREWQLAQQVAGLAPPPAMVAQPSPEAREYAYPPAYGPYYSPPPYYYPSPYYYPPRYYAPGPAYWGPSICAGGFGHGWGGRVCF